MHFSWTLILTFVSLSLLGFSLAVMVFDCLFRYRMTVQERLNALSNEPSSDCAVSLFKDLRQSHTQQFSRQMLRVRLQRFIDEAGSTCTVGVLLKWCLFAGIITALGGSCCAYWLGACLLPVGAILPIIVLFMRRHVRQRKFLRQLPEAFAMISRAVRAGQTVPAALQIIADDFDPPISTEFTICHEQQSLGMGRESALRQLATRTGIMELQIFVVALLVQAKSGGDLVELLDNLAAMIRKRLKLKDRVRALTGEGRMQAIVLIVLPIAAMMGTIFFAPEYAQTLLDRPGLLAATAAAQTAGVFWIRKIVNFEY
jgi:tight adherence protein B